MTTNNKNDPETPYIITDAVTVEPTQEEYQPTVASAPPPKNAPVVVFEYSRNPMNLDKCPHCHQPTRTRIVSYPSFVTWISVVFIFFIFWPLFWLPLILESTRHTDHFCSKCGAKIGEIGAYKDCCVSTRH